MSDQTEFTLPKELKGALQALFPQPRPAPAFVDRLGRELSAQAPQPTKKRARFQSLFSPLAWAGAGIVLFLVMALVITRLLPHAEPGGPLPGEILSSTPTSLPIIAPSSTATHPSSTATQSPTSPSTSTLLPTPTFTQEPTATAGITQTYTNQNVGYSLDYPTGWYITDQGSVVILSSLDLFRPGGNSPGPNDIQINLYPMYEELPDLETIRRTIETGGNQFIDAKEWTSSGGISGLWVQVRGEYRFGDKAGYDQYPYLYLSLGDRLLEVFAIGDLSRFESIISTLRPAGWRVSTPNPPLLESPTATPSLDYLVNILHASDPDLPQYDPRATAYAEFADALNQLSAMGPGAMDAISHIAHAISFPRRDSYLAAQALISFGPDIAATTLPVIIDNLHGPRTEPRLYSTIVLGSIGEQATCAVGDIGPLLWDGDPSVRFAAAYALTKITGNNLLSSEVKAIPDLLSPQSIPSDTPEGSIVGDAREWWTMEGSQVNWHPSYGICDP